MLLIKMCKYFHCIILQMLQLFEWPLTYNITISDLFDFVPYVPVQLTARGYCEIRFAPNYQRKTKFNKSRIFFAITFNATYYWWWCPPVCPLIGNHMHFVLESNGGRGFVRLSVYLGNTSSCAGRFRLPLNLCRKS